MKTIDIVFKGEGPYLEFVELEDEGASIKLGEWVDRGDGFCALRIPDPRQSLKVYDDEIMSVHVHRSQPVPIGHLRIGHGEYEAVAGMVYMPEGKQVYETGSGRTVVEAATDAAQTLMDTCNEWLLQDHIDKCKNLSENLTHQCNKCGQKAMSKPSLRDREYTCGLNLETGEPCDGLMVIL